MNGSVKVNDEEKFESSLKGNTLRVYWMMLKSGIDTAVGVRQVQRTLGFSSPTLAAYHLDKLVELGLVEKKHGEYHLERRVKVGVLKQFTRIGTFFTSQIYLLCYHVHYSSSSFSVKI